VSSSVVIGAPTLGESSGVRRSVLGALRDSVRYLHSVSVEDAHRYMTREGSGGFRCSGGPGLLGVLGDVSQSVVGACRSYWSRNKGML
jgi:hypothetical protein